jgi:hypothetical protein
MAERYPLTVEQMRQTNRDVAAMTEHAEEIAQLLLAGYGEHDRRTIRAQEVHAALVRLQTELGREPAQCA